MQRDGPRTGPAGQDAMGLQLACEEMLERFWHQTARIVGPVAPDCLVMNEAIGYVREEVSAQAGMQGHPEQGENLEQRVACRTTPS